MGLFNAKTDDSNKKNANTKSPKIVDKAEADKGKSMKDLYDTEGKIRSDKVKKTKKGQAYRILVRPMITEKATNLSSINQYIFMVSNDANKIDIADAILEVYGIRPISVNIIKSKGKKVNRGRIVGKRRDFKKAIVTLKKGESISIYEGV